MASSTLRMKVRMRERRERLTAVRLAILRTIFLADTVLAIWQPRWWRQAEHPSGVLHRSRVKRRSGHTAGEAGLPAMARLLLARPKGVNAKRVGCRWREEPR